MGAIVKIDAAEYGLEESKAQQISDMFKPMLDRMVELEKDYNEVVQLEISEDACDRAKNLRMQYVKVRTGTAKIHKGLKQFYLQGGRFVDGWKNAQLMTSQGIEEKLVAIEKHYENIEIERVAKLQEERFAAISKYVPDCLPTDYAYKDLGSMPDAVWVNFLAGTKNGYAIQAEAERKAEGDRIAKEKAEAEEQERIRKENQQLKEAAQERERVEKIEADARAIAEAERIAKEEAERKARDEKERKEREAFEAKLKTEREAREAAEKKEREAQAKIRAEQKAKEATEARERAEAEKQKQAELNKNDKARTLDLIKDLVAIKVKYEFKSKKNQVLYSAVATHIDKILRLIDEGSK